MPSANNRSVVRNGFEIAVTICLIVVPCLAQRDPGVRKGTANAGTPLQGLTPIELSMFNEGLQRAIQLEAACDDCADLQLGSSIDPEKGKLVYQTNSAGLGTRFNGDQCLGCHNQPVLGGSGGFMVPNPQDPPNRQRRPENTPCSTSFPTVKVLPTKCRRL